MTRPLDDAVRLGLALAAMAALITVSWLSFERAGFGVVDVGRVVGLALVPALVVLATRRLIAGVGAFAIVLLPVAGLALGIPVTDMRPGERDFFGPLLAAVGDGFDGFYATRIPIRVAEHPEMAGLVLIAIFLFVAISTLLLAAGHPLLGAATFVVGVGWPATVAATIPGATPLRTGGIVLAAVLLVLLLTREGRRPLRSLGPAVALGAVLVVASVAAASTGAVAKPAFVESWQTWNFDPEPDRVGVKYVWSSNYSGIDFPGEETVVLRIKAPEGAQYWRATTLDEYTGVGWREDLVPVGQPAVQTRVNGLSGLSDSDLPPLARQRRNWTRQDVTVEALADTHLVAAPTPVRFALGKPATVQLHAGGVVLVPEGLEYRQRYTVWSYAPSLKPSALAGLSANYPPSLDRFLEIVPGVVVPGFGTPGRREQVEELLSLGAADPLLAAHEPLYRQALDIAGAARSPYVVAASLEAWFRSEGGFSYVEQPDQPVDGTPPLVDFVQRTKEGYCQHFAGSMAVMLRLLGIPARVAAGFTSGKYDNGRDEWVVTDHNAHTWVEVWFPRYGWLAFDPTPGRGRLAAGYSTTSETFNQSIQQLASSGLGLTPTLARIANVRAANAGAASSETSADAVAVTGGGGVARALWIALAVVGSLAALALLVLGVKALRRRLRFARKDARGVASACRRELTAFLAERQVRVPEDLTLIEIGELVRRRFRVDPTGFVAAAEAARFGPPERADRAAASARSALRQLEREITRRQSAAARAAGALSLRSLTA